MARPQTGGEKLYVKNVFHKAFIEVDEKGTEAAASTAVVMNTKSIRVPVQFRADHPFVFLLRDKKTGLILFVGRVAEPRGGAALTTARSGP
jgi:serpin B